MKKINSLVAFLLLLQFSFAQSTKTYLVVFKDKKNSPYSISDPKKYLSEKSIARRQKQHIAINSSDLPVNSTYINDVKSTGVQVKNQSKWMNAIAISTADDNRITEIKKLSFVKEIILTSDEALVKKSTAKFDEEHEIKQVSLNASNQRGGSTVLNYGPSYFQVNQIGMDCMHNAGFMGQGITIAVLDAGFQDANILPAFDSLWTNHQILGCRDIVVGDTLVFEDFPHGMNVLSCIGGNLPGQLIGTAPKAKFWLLRTEDAFTETLQEEVNWLVGAEFADSVGVDVINSSLGYNKFDGGVGDHFYSDMNGHATIITNAADWAVSKGIFVTTSAGNAGGPPWYKITAPADADSVLTVGAVDSAGIIAGFSSRGLTFDGRIKPNTCARGVQAVVASTLGGIAGASGTSFSSPITAGAVACLLQANPSATPVQLISAIQLSATQAFAPDSVQGYGIPNFCKADSILSAVLSITDFSATEENTLVVYPNPFNSNFVVEFYATKKETVLIELFDISGREVLHQEQPVFANTNNKLTFTSASNLAKGAYSLRLISSDKTYYSKIIKQ